MNDLGRNGLLFWGWAWRRNLGFVGGKEIYKKLMCGLCSIDRFLQKSKGYDE